MDAQFTLSSKRQVSSARERIGCSGYCGPAVALAAMDPALQAHEGLMVITQSILNRKSWCGGRLSSNG